MSAGESTQKRIAAQVNAFKVSAIQMASGPNVEGNLSEARRLIANAAGQGARLVVLPEFFPIMGMNELDKVRVREEPGRGNIQSFLSETARQTRFICSTSNWATKITTRRTR
jgi:predicted amidohydrolase